MPPKQSSDKTGQNKGKGKGRATGTPIQPGGKETASRPSRSAAQAAKIANKRDSDRLNAEDEDDFDNWRDTPASVPKKPRKPRAKAPATGGKRGRANSTISEVNAEAQQGPPKKKSRRGGRRKGKEEPEPEETYVPPPQLLFLQQFSNRLPTELRNDTFFTVIRGTRSDQQLPHSIRQISLGEKASDMAVGEQQLQLIVSEASPIGTYVPKFVENIQQLDYKKVMTGTTEARKKKLFNQFISAIASQEVFEFRNTGYFHDFADSLIPWLQYDKTLCTKLHLRLHVFNDAKDWRGMNVMKETILPHGYEEDAEDHFAEWIEALQAVIEAAKVCHIEIEVDLILHRPYLNYLVIREWCNLVFRQETVGDLGSTIKLNMLCIDIAPWSELLLHPQADDIDIYHTLLACSVFGEKLLEPVRECLEGNFERLERLVDHGCLGIRE